MITQSFCPFLDSCPHPHLSSWWYSSWVHVRWASQEVLLLKNPPANEGDARATGSISGLEQSPGVENDNPFQYSCLENPMVGRARRATVHGAAKSWTWLSTHTHAMEDTLILERPLTDCANWLQCALFWSLYSISPPSTAPRHPCCTPATADGRGFSSARPGARSVGTLAGSLRSVCPSGWDKLIKGRVPSYV